MDREITKMEITAYVKCFYDTIECAFKKFLPSRQKIRTKPMNRKSTPYTVHFSKDCLDARKSFLRARRAFDRNPTDTNYAIMYKRRMIKSSLERRCARAAERDFLARMLDQRNSSLLWDQVRLKSHTPYNGPLDTKVYTEFLSDIANGKFPYDAALSEQATRRMNSLCLMTGVPKDITDNLLNEFPFSPILQPKLRKAVGTDGWSGELVQCLFPVLSEILPFIFALCLKSGTTPDQWDKDLKVPLPKPGKPLDKPNSLRPITLVNVVMKQYEQWLISLLNQYCTTSEYQAGFKQGYSCTGRLFLLRGLVEQQLSTRSCICAVFIDFSSFFDTVRGEILCFGLCERGVPEYLVRAIYGMLKDVKACVQMKGCIGQYFPCKVGLRQGSKSSPKLATLFLDKITQLLESCNGGISLLDQTLNHIFYADDLVLLFSNWEDTNRALARLKDLCERVGLHVSTEKSFGVQFSKRTKIDVAKIGWGNETLPFLNSAKYLGCTLDSRGRFEQHINLVEKKAHRAFSILLNFQKRFPLLPFQSFLKLYITLVYPVYAYSSEVFGWSEGERMNNIYIEHMRRYFGLHKRTAKFSILFLTGTFPIQTRVWKTAYHFWKSTSGLGENRLEKMIYRSMKMSSKPTWFSEMLTIFHEIGFQDDFKFWDKAVISANSSRFVDSMEKYFFRVIEEWKNNTSYKFLTENVVFKEHHPQFLDKASYWDRRVLVKLVLKGYHFESTTGAWHKIDKRVRFCEYCLSNNVFSLGDEEHYLLKCPKFSKNRSKLSIPSSDILPILFNKFLGNTTTSCQYHSLAKFIKQSFDQLPDPYCRT